MAIKDKSKNAGAGDSVSANTGNGGDTSTTTVDAQAQAESLTTEATARKRGARKGVAHGPIYDWGIPGITLERKDAMDLALKGVLKAELGVGATRTAVSVARALAGLPEFEGLDANDLPGLVRTRVKVIQKKFLDTKREIADWAHLDSGRRGYEVSASILD